MRSNLCTSLITVSTTVRNKVTKTESEKQEEELCSKTIHLAMRTQLHLPALDLSWVVEWTSYFFHGALRPQKPQNVLGTGEAVGIGRLYTYRYTVTTRMTPALRRAAVRAILMFH